MCYLGLEQECRRSAFTIPLYTGKSVKVLGLRKPYIIILPDCSVGSFLMCCRNLMWLAQGHSAGQKLSGIKAVNPAAL